MEPRPVFDDAQLSSAAERARRQPVDPGITWLNFRDFPQPEVVAWMCRNLDAAPEYEPLDVVRLANDDPAGYAERFQRRYPRNNLYRALFEGIAAESGRGTVEQFLLAVHGGLRSVYLLGDWAFDPEDRVAPSDRLLSAVVDVDRTLFGAIATVLAGALSSAESAEERGELRVRGLVYDGRYDEARAELAAHGSRLAEELGFLRCDDPDRHFVAGLWAVLAEPNDFPLRPPARAPAAPRAPRPPSEPVLDPAASPSGPAPRGAARREHRPAPVQVGQALEEATASLFARFFTLSPANRGELINGIRRQHPGTQFGYDVKLTLAVAEHPRVLCHLECKHLRVPVTPRDISDKLLQTKLYYRDAQIDHWILVSPHTDPSNELQDMLDHWAKVDEFPFTVQVWSPQSGVRELFSLAPDVYRAIYGEAPDRSWPEPRHIVADIRRRLAPHVRLAPVWRDYLRKPAKHCVGGEKPDHFAELMEHHVDVKATDANGSILEGTLVDHVRAWLDRSSPGALVLLADFGEGKSFFTYQLSQLLCQGLLDDPAGGVLPLRIPLGQFKAAGDGRRLLERRLSELGASVAEWRDVTASTRCLVILDGFDEMSTDLSEESIEENIAGLESCIRELHGADVRILVTSRGRVFDVGRNRERILDRLGRPEILKFSPVARTERIRYLERSVDDARGRERLTNLRGLYDPIGLAAKPLFLQMIRETLTDLPDGRFSELILYRTYVRQSLYRKIEYLRARKITDGELFDNLLLILEKVAVELQRANSPYAYLSEVAGSHHGLARTLWQTRDGADDGPGDSADAAARVSIRSLLKAAPAPDQTRWPVTFFHRSMQEYFVAGALVRALRYEHAEARTLLDDLPPLPEIVHFAASMIRALPDPPAIWGTLESLTRSAITNVGTKYLGGHAITLLHAAGGRVPKEDCSRLQLDYASLDGVDLSGGRLVGTSLRHANLDNANLERADLTGANLEGVRLEETSTVVGVTALGGGQLVAAYDDRSIRTWQRQPGGQWRSTLIGTAEHDIERIQATRGGRLLVFGDSALSVLTPRHPSWVRDARIPTKPTMRPPAVGASRALVEWELPDGASRLLWLDPSARAGRELFVGMRPVTCYAQLDGVACAVATEFDVAVKGEGLSTRLGLRNVHCLDLLAAPDGGVLVVSGHRAGDLVLTSVRSSKVVEHWRVRRHDSMITSVAFIDGDRIVSGGIDRAVKVTSTATGDPVDEHAVMLLTLRCQGVRYDGVLGERERQLLAAASGAGRAADIDRV